jgi:predicted N-acetyltransferase YhbS
MLHLTPEGPLDGPAIENLLDRSFGVRRQRKLSYRYRVGREPEAELSLVAHDAGRLVGSIRYWRLLLGDTPVLLLGPLAVEPGLRGKGIGRALVRETLLVAEAGAFRLVLLVGDPAYYAQFGFVVAPSMVVMPGEDPARLQWLALGDVALPLGGGILRRWPDGGIAGDAIQPGQQRRAHRRDALVAGHAGLHLAQPCGQGGGHARLGGDLGQRPDKAADAEDHGPAHWQPAQRLPFDAQPQPLAGVR